MTDLLSPRSSQRRKPSEFTLSATRAQDQTGGPSLDARVPGGITWVLVAAGGAVVTALAGWVLIAGLAVVGWLSASSGSLGSALATGTELWLLSNGTGAQLGSISITLMPWGATALILFMISRVARLAARSARDQSWSTVVGVSVVTTVAYLAVLLPVALLLGHPLEAVRGALIMGLSLAAATVWGSSRGAGVALTANWPAWSQRIPAAVAAAQLVLLATGSALLLTAALLRLDRMEQLLTALQPGVAGHIVLLVVQVAFVPNLIVWSTSYALGAGFGLGAGSVVAPAGTNLGLLPSIPLLGALPGEGPGSGAPLWWLAGGVLAGVVAAVVILRARPAARFDETSLVGGLAGAVSGLVFVGLAWLSGGDLGMVRLADVGPRLVPLLILSVSTLGLSGLAAGLVLGLGRGVVLPWLRTKLRRARAS